MLYSHNSCEITPGVSWCKNSIVERARSASTLSYCGATVSVETSQVVLDLYQTFHRQSECQSCLPKIMDNRSVLVKLNWDIVAVWFFPLRHQLY